MPDLNLNKALDRAKKQEMDFLLAVNTSGEPVELLVQNRIEKSRVIKEQREMMETYGKTTLFLTGKCNVEDRDIRFELSDGLKPVEWKDQTLVRNLIKRESGFPAKDTTFGFYKQFEWESKSQEFVKYGLHQKDERSKSMFEEASKLALENNYKIALRKLSEISESFQSNATEREKSAEKAFFDSVNNIKRMMATIKEHAENDERLSEALENAKLKGKEAVGFAHNGEFIEANKLITQLEDFLKSVIGEDAFEDTASSANNKTAVDGVHTDCPDEYVFAPELSDEFIGGPLDTSKWYDHNPNSAGRKPGYFSPANVSIMDGKLYLCAKSEDLNDVPEGYHC